MALAPSNLRFGAHYLGEQSYAPRAVLLWDENETNACFYRIESKATSAGAWEHRADVPKGKGFTFVTLGYFSGTTPTFIQHGNTATLNVYSFRVTCVKTSDGSTAAASPLLAALPALGVAAPSGLTVFNALHGTTLDLFLAWDDASAWLNQTKVELFKVGGNGSPIFSTLNNRFALDPIIPDYVASARLIEGPVETVGPGPTFGERGPRFNLQALNLERWQPLSTFHTYNGRNALQDGDVVSVRISTRLGDTSLTKVTALNFTFWSSVEIGGYRPFATQNQPISIDFNDGLIGSITAASWAISGTLPTGLSFNATTGVLSGTPTTIGTYPFRISVTNLGGQVTTEARSIKINVAHVPLMTGPAAVSMLVGVQQDVFLLASGNPTSFSVDSGTLPAGMALLTGGVGGLVSGTPTAAGTYAVDFVATNNDGDSAPFTVTFTVAGTTTPTINSAAARTAWIGEPMPAYRITSSTNYNVDYYEAVGLPPGLRQDDSNPYDPGNNRGDLIVGTPTATGVYKVSLFGHNVAGRGPKFTLTVTVNSRIPVITSALAVPAQVGKAFRYRIIATRFPTFYNATDLPIGLSIDITTGLITGTPEEDGVFSVPLTAGNASGTGTATLVITVAVRPVPVIHLDWPQPTIAQVVGRRVHRPLHASNSPTQWAASWVPDGLDFDPEVGLFTGHYLSPGTYSIILHAYNETGASDPAVITWIVAPRPPPKITQTGV